MAKPPWTTWHEAVVLRADLKSGELPMHLFAADLYEVVMQNGKRPIYEKPDEFFALTFPTHNLRNLIRDVALRLAGKNDKAVRQLELTYGGGKTHTLITMRHLVHDPANLPDLPAVHEFTVAIGQTPPRARVAALCFDKLDAETGMEVRSPEGTVRKLKQPWSVLAYQIAGDQGLSLMHAQGRAEERSTPPAENTLAELLSSPLKDQMGTLILIDEVLLYAKVKLRSEPGWIDVLTAFFQYLTQAAAKVDRCCVVASLLSSDPRDQADDLGRKIVSDLHDVFRRQLESAVQPVEEADVAEVLRRRLFDPVLTRDRAPWKQHVIAAVKSIAALDDQTDKDAAAAEERYLKSYPFHPELTGVFYTKWSAGLERFQRTRGVLRTFALALRDAEKWDQSPLIGPAVFLNAPGSGGLSDAARDLVTVVDADAGDGRATRWTGILESELSAARQVQDESVGLKYREIEQAVIATFLHSQPTGRTAKTRDLILLISPTRPDKIELEKGLVKWSRASSWLDDEHAPDQENRLRDEWRLGNRPNLNQMHSAAKARIQDAAVNSRLIDEIGRLKALTTGASAAGAKVHTLPAKPRDVEDDGGFHYAVLLPGAACDPGKPSPEARRFLDETSGPDKPRVFRNAVLLLAPSKDGLAAAQAAVRDYLAWQTVLDELTLKTDEERKQKGPIDLLRGQTLKANVDKSRGRIAAAVRQAYCVVVTVSDKNEVQALKIGVSEEPHFETIKKERRFRIQEAAIAAEALLPDGPYNLWRDGETSRRVKDLAGAFAQLPHLPKMLKAQAIVETLVEGCVQGSFVLRLARPDRTFRTWWRTRPDAAAMADPALELVLPQAALLSEIPRDLVAPKALPDLWTGDEITAQAVIDYFAGGKVVEVDRGSYRESTPIPKAPAAAVEDAVKEAVAAGTIWLSAEPASLLAEEIPVGVLTPSALLRVPPAPVAATAILPEILPAAWNNGHTSALAIASALSQKAGRALPWKTVRDVISGALNARFLILEDGSAPWPVDFPAANAVKIRHGVVPPPPPPPPPGPTVTLRAKAVLEPAQIQDLAEHMADLLKIKDAADAPLVFQIQIDYGDAKNPPTPESTAALNEKLEAVKPGLRLG